jgi:glucose-1-phosphate adenylyltransferase
VLPDGLRVGVDPALDRERFHVTDGGVVVLTPDRLAALRDPRAAAAVAPTRDAAAAPQPG